MSLNVFQIVVLPIVAILFVERAAAVARGRIPRRVAVFWMLLWLAAGIAVTWPDLTTKIANVFGIGKGINLVVYFSVLFMFIGFYNMYVRLRRLDANITLLVRHLAVTNAQLGAAALQGNEPPSRQDAKDGEG